MKSEYFWLLISMVRMKLIGRIPETQILLNALKSKRPELIAVYGRRRVGKTFLIRSVYKKDILFEYSGIH